MTNEQDRLAKVHLNTAKSLAHQMKVPTDAHEFDDVVQEGAIAAWLATKDGDRREPVTYGMVAARRRMVDRLREHGQPYGSERKGGLVHDLHKKIQQRDSFEVTEGIPSRRNEYNDVELRVDVEQALGGLSDRDHAIARGIGADLLWPQIAELVGMSNDGARNRWRRILKPDLAKRLEHVRTAA